MKIERLKPYVFKVEGPVNFAFYDMLNGKFYHFSPEGSLEEVKKYLLQEGLIFATEGVVPSQVIKPNLWDVQNNLMVRQLQIRLNGSGEDNCWNRGKKSDQPRWMTIETLERLFGQCRYIPIQKIKIETETFDQEKIEKILENIHFKELELNIEEKFIPEQWDTFQNIVKNRGLSTQVNIADNRKRNPHQLEVEIFNFFYSRYYNPCLGHQVAIDTGGEIKYCLWSDDILGDIRNKDLKDMIIKGCFDSFWEMNKGKIEVCRDCELKAACSDCRVMVLKNNAPMNSKPLNCRYDPYTGKYI